MTTVEVVERALRYSPSEGRDLPEFQNVAKDKILDDVEEFLQRARDTRDARKKPINKVSAHGPIGVLTYRTRWETYLLALRRTWVTATIVLLATVALCVFSLTDVIAFARTGTSILHPYFSMVLALTTTLLFIVAVSSIVGANRKIEAFIWGTLKILH